MYSIYADGVCIYSDVFALESMKVLNPKLTMEDNAAGSLVMTLPPQNVGYNTIDRLTTDISVQKDGKELWSGRVLQENKDFYNNRVLYCEGELAFFNDSTQPPGEHAGLSVRAYMERLINVHNSKVPANRQFRLGAVTVVDTNYPTYYTNYEKTIAIFNSLVEAYGGHAMQFASTAKDSAQASAANAQRSANTATQKAGEATASAGAAKVSETNAKSSETVAVQKAGEAITAAAEAKASEIAAENSATLATQKAEEAEDSKDAAALSEAEAKAAEERAKEIKKAVQYLGDQAEADKVAAEASRLAAEAARDAAALSESNARSSANTALTAKAGADVAKDDAQAAALEAKTSKSAAEKAKDDAQAAKEAAETSEQAASDSADEAATSALSAKQYSGKPPKPQDGMWWIWDAGKQAYVDSGISCELVGPIGIGIADIQLTKGDHTPGTTDIYTVTLTDDTSYNISVYNGRNGTGAGDVLGIWFDLVIPAAGWANGEITIADSRLLALATHSYLLRADQASREEFLDCNVQPKDITTTGFITFTNDTDPTTDLTVNIIRLELPANGA